MRLRAMTLALAMGAAGCAVTTTMSDKLAVVPLVNGLNGAGKRVAAALVHGDANGLTSAERGFVVRGRTGWKEVAGAHFKVRKLIETSDDAVRARCERRMRGIRADGGRREWIEWCETQFAKRQGRWVITEFGGLEGRRVEGEAVPPFEDWTARSGVAFTYEEHHPVERRGRGLLSRRASRRRGGRGRP
jgi:hypothetical protein